MIVVLDASAAVDLLLSTERAPRIAHALATVSEAHAPELIDPEALAVIRRFTLRGWIDVPAGERAVAELSELALVRHRHGTLHTRVWELRDRASAYDACYLALAEQLDAILITTDARLARASHGLVELAFSP